MPSREEIIDGLVDRLNRAKDRKDNCLKQQAHYQQLSTRGRGPKAGQWNSKNASLAKLEKKKIKSIDSHISKLRQAISGKNVMLTDSESSDTSDGEAIPDPAPAPVPAKKEKKPKTFSQNPAVSASEVNQHGAAVLPPAPNPVLLPAQFEAKVMSGAVPGNVTNFTKYKIPKALMPQLPSTTPAENTPAAPPAPANPTPDQMSTILHLQRSVDSLQSALNDSEASLTASIEHTEDVKSTLETALGDAQREIQTLRLYYDDEISKLSGLLTASNTKADLMSDQLSQLKSHFTSSNEYKNWRLAVSSEAFRSLPEKLAKQAEDLKSCTEEEVAIIIKVAVKMASHNTKVESAVMLMSDPTVAAKVNAIPTWGATPQPQRVHNSTPISARAPLRPALSSDNKLPSELTGAAGDRLPATNPDEGAATVAAGESGGLHLPRKDADDGHDSGLGEIKDAAIETDDMFAEDQ